MILVGPHPVGPRLHALTSRSTVLETAHLTVRRFLARTGADGNPYTPLVVDGVLGPISTRALQWKLNSRGVLPALAVDGSYGHLTSTNTETEIGAPHYTSSAQWLWPGRANTNATKLQHYITSLGIGVGITGVWDSNTSKGLQITLNNGTF